MLSTIRKAIVIVCLLSLVTPVKAYDISSIDPSSDLIQKQLVFAAGVVLSLIGTWNLVTKKKQQTASTIIANANLILTGVCISLFSAQIVSMKTELVNVVSKLYYDYKHKALPGHVGYFDKAGDWIQTTIDGYTQSKPTK